MRNKERSAAMARRLKKLTATLYLLLPTPVRAVLEPPVPYLLLLFRFHHDVGQDSVHFVD